jgi:hypothetical protein
MTFIRLPHALMAAALEVPLAFGGFASNAQAETVLRVIPHADLKNFDPEPPHLNWSTVIFRKRRT